MGDPFEAVFATPTRCQLQDELANLALAGNAGAYLAYLICRPTRLGAGCVGAPRRGNVHALNRARMAPSAA